VTLERSGRSLAVALLAILATLVAGLGAATSAGAATTSTGHGWANHATQTDHRVTVDGWAFDSAHPTAEVTVQLWVDGHNLGSRATNVYNAAVNSAYHLTGDHGFRFDVSYPYWGKTAAVYILEPKFRLPLKSIVRLYTPGERIIMQAKRYVGYPYVEGGASPSPGFDCSGYTQYVYSTAHVASLVHNAEGQRHQARAISRSAARPGDLVFYLSGGTAYHVAVYAGSGMQYAAATPRDGVRYQAIWSSAVTFGTTWH
jgi:hypothetical protein